MKRIIVPRSSDRAFFKHTAQRTHAFNVSTVNVSRGGVRL